MTAQSNPHTSKVRHLTADPGSRNVGPGRSVAALSTGGARRDSGVSFNLGGRQPHCQAAHRCVDHARCPVGARTSRVRLGTAIFLAALRHPVLLAYQLASLDWMTGGRIDLGVGFGRRGEASQEHEFKILGLDPAARMKMSEEAVHIMRRLWRENDVAYDGAFTRFEQVTIEPKPAQPGGVPIWMAANDVEAGLRRVGRLGDAWMNNIKDPETYRICWAKIRGYAAEAGRNPDGIQPGAYFTIAAGDKDAIVEGERFLAEYYNRSYEAIVKAALCITGSWEEVLDRLAGFINAGARTIVLRFAARDQLAHLEKCAEALDRRGLLS